MTDDVRALARIGAVQAAVVTGVIHLAEGLPRLAVYLPRASLADPRPYLFVPSAVALLAAAAAVYSGRWVRSAAAVGATVSAAYLAGYAWWHLTGHGGLIPAHEAADPLGELAGHLAADPVALVAAAAETLGLVAFGALAVVGAGRAVGVTERVERHVLVRRRLSRSHGVVPDGRGPGRGGVLGSRIGVRRLRRPRGRRRRRGGDRRGGPGRPS